MVQTLEIMKILKEIKSFIWVICNGEMNKEMKRYCPSELALFPEN